MFFQEASYSRHVEFVASFSGWFRFGGLFPIILFGWSGCGHVSDMWLRLTILPTWWRVKVKLWSLDFRV